MARKRQFLVERPTPYNPTVRPKGTPTVPWGRAWTLADGDKRVVVEVEANAAALDAYLAGTLPQTGRLAIQTEGRSAVESHLDDRKLPTRILITAAGVRRSK